MSEPEIVQAFGAIAQSYARLGLRVFPLAPRSKVPLTPRGFKDATDDIDQVRRWWAERPDANIGIACGESSGLFVVDVDGPAGEAALAWLEADWGSLPPTAEVRTGKGRHLYFRHFPGSRNTASYLGEHIDTRGEGGYVVAPPSIHPDGGVYAWAERRGPRDIRRADAPEWLCKRLEKPVAAAPAASTWKPTDERTSKRARAFVLGALRREHDEVSRAPSGTRNARLSQAAYALGGYVSTGFLDEHEIRDALRSAAQASGLLAEDGERKCMDTIDRGIEAGINAPRPLPEERPEATRYEDPAYESNITPPTVGAPLPPAAPTWKTPAQRALELGSQGERMGTGFPTLDEWSRGGLLGKRLVAIGGAPGAGKTTLALQLAHHYRDAGHVVGVLASDEDADGLLMRWGQQCGLVREDLERGCEMTRAALAQYVISVDLAMVDADDENASIEDVAKWVADRAAGTGRPGVLIVDSIQTARCKDAENMLPRERVDATVVALKRARRLGDGLLVIATSEVARGFYRGGSERTEPLAAFKESGGIEYGLDLAIVLDSVKDEVGQVDVYIPKSRLGRSDRFAVASRMSMDFARAKFSELSKPSETDGEAYEPDDSEEVEAAAREISLALATCKGDVTTRKDLERLVNRRTAIASRAISLLFREGRITGGRGTPFKAVAE